MPRLSVLALAIVATGMSAATAFGQVSIEPLQIVVGGTHSSGLAVSGDGATVVGYSGTTSSQPFAHRWRAGGTLNLGTLPGYDRASEARGVSADGSVIVGVSRGVLYNRAVRWTSSGVVELPVGPNADSYSEAHGVSADGKVIVGFAPGPDVWQDACYWNGTGLHRLGSINDVDGDSVALACSADGRVIVGSSASDNAFVKRAFRWENGVMEDLGSPEGAGGYSVAHDVSADGEVVVGAWNVLSGRAFRWTRTGGLADLPPVDGIDGIRRAFGVSDDGRTIVGYSAHSFSRPGGTACIWRDGQPRQLWDLLANDYGLDLASQGWTSLDEVTACSANGAVLTGKGVRREGPSQPFIPTPFRVVIPRLNNLPVVAGPVADGGTVVAREGGLLTVAIEGWDPDAGDRLTLEASVLPAGATLTPAQGTKKIGTEQAPFVATIEWTPDGADVGVPRDVTISFRDDMNGVAGLSFTIDVISNDPPTVEPITPVAIECVDGQHLVALATTVDDPDDDPLTVTWKVNGDTVETQSVDAGEEVEYEGDYEHGENVVEVVVSDGILETTTTTTVTVEDTEDPTIVVTPHVDLTTDPGQAFATTARLAPPTAEDSSGHPVTFEHDAPATLSLGEHVIVWTATDIGGNEVTAEQTVTVVDKEKPKIGSLPEVLAYCDAGKTYATPKLKKPKATDNVPGPISVAAVVPSRFEIGTTNVVWTALDAAGNVARKRQKVTVRNRKPTAHAGRDVVVTTKSERGEKVSLDGRGSSDPDKHALKFAWSARGVRLAPASSRPTGLFPVGTTTVTLTVTDAGGAKDTDTVRVTVKLKNGRKRSFGEQANASFAQAAGAAGSVADRTEPNGSLLRGLAYANAASGLRDATGGFLRWEEGQSEADALLAYSELRALQQAYGAAATNALLSAYAETGDESLLSACSYSAYGTLAAEADLREP